MSMTIGVHVYYLPFYHQSVRGNTASQSGIRTLPYLMTLLLSPMISGSLITLVGYYVPFMWAGSALITVGSVLLYRLTTTSSTGELIGYQFLAAFVVGISRQIAFSAVPLVLAEDDLPVASALVAFCNSLGPTLAIVSGIDGKAVVNEGATDLSALVPGPVLGVVIQAFNLALTRAFALAIA
ncbi:hypothetical protein MMC07_004901 [Pseudocyphellaria aurata]|nr:hypothetical protein [Pseudocyphellaria aurata]